MVSAPKILPETTGGFSVFCRNLFGAGIYDRSFSGVEMGNALVGLQRTFFKSPWTNLSAGSCYLWTGRYAVDMLFFSIIYEMVSPPHKKMAGPSVYIMSGSFCAGYHLLRNDS